MAIDFFALCPVFKNEGLAIERDDLCLLFVAPNIIDHVLPFGQSIGYDGLKVSVDIEVRLGFS